MAKNYKVTADDAPKIVNAAAPELERQTGTKLGTVDKKNFRERLGVVAEQPETANSFWDILINQVYTTIFMTRLWDNPLAQLKTGDVPVGEIVRAIGLNPAEVKDFNTDEDTLWSKVISDAKVEYHNMNSQKFTTVSMSDAELKLAFSSAEGLAKAINDAVETLYNGQYIYEYNTLIDTVNTAINNGYVTTDEIAAPVQTDGGADAFINKLMDLKSAFAFIGSDYNKYSDFVSEVGVSDFKTFTSVDDIIILMPYGIKNKMSIYSLAKAFNMSELELNSKIIEVKTLGKLSTTTEAGTTEQDINALICDRRFFVWKNYLQRLKRDDNARTLITKYYNHFWNCFDISLLCNAVALVEPLPTP